MAASLSSTASEHGCTAADRWSACEAGSRLGLCDELLRGGGVAERCRAGAAGDLPHAAEALQRDSRQLVSIHSCAITRTVVPPPLHILAQQSRCFIILLAQHHGVSEEVRGAHSTGSRRVRRSR
jgi:hypothetical protein